MNKLWVIFMDTFNKGIFASQELVSWGNTQLQRASEPAFKALYRFQMHQYATSHVGAVNTSLSRFYHSLHISSLHQGVRQQQKKKPNHVVWAAAR